MRVKRQQSNIGTRFEPNAFYENLLTQHRSGKLDITLLSGPTRAALDAYTLAKREFEMLNREGRQ